MNASTRKQVMRWMLDRVRQGILHEEEGSCDFLDDAENYRWNCTVGEENGKKVVFFTTCETLFPFATGYLAENGKPCIKWN